MSTTNRVSDKIDELVRLELNDHPERLVSFFERVRSNYDEAIRSASGFFLAMLAAWFLTFAIHQQWITKISFLGGVELNPKSIVLSPFLIGLLSYGLLSALAGAVVFWEAFSRGVFHTLQSAWNQSLDDLLAPPTFSNVERMLEPRPENTLLSLFSRGWFVLVTLMMFIGSLASIVHTMYLLLDPSWSAVVILSAILGGIAWLRGVVLFVSAINATGGFHLGHHRGSGRVGV